MPKQRKADGSESTTDYTDSSSPEKQSGSGGPDTSSAAGVVDSAKQVAGQAKEAAGNMFDQAKQQVTSRADEQRQTVASGLQAVAQAFRSLGDDLRTKEQGPIADYAAEMGHALGGQVERVANHLREQDVRQLLSETEDFARRSPALFLGGAFLLGIAASRFLKSSRPAAPATPAFMATMPDPNRALPPATTPVADLGPSRTSSDPLNTAPFWATESKGTLTETGHSSTTTPVGKNPVGA